VSNLRQTSRGVLWLVDAERTWYQLTVVFQGGWRIVSAWREEQALLQAHGFASGWLQYRNHARLFRCEIQASVDRASQPRAADA
jgi:hypothetical protein